MTNYLLDEKYNKLVRILANLPPDPLAGRVTEDQVKLALGAIADS